MFFQRPIEPVTHPPLRGVNLGGWLVLEKWITPSLFKNTQATDEYRLHSNLVNPGLDSALAAHRDTFITKADFEWLAKQGIQAVRLPVGYWVFGDKPPYSGSIQYVDKAFQWAHETGIHILLDMHAAPGSQNGSDHSGRAGAAAWADDEQNIIETLEVLHKLATRYAKHPQLLGIELLNEPKSSLPKSALLRYYKAAYSLLRKTCGPNVWVVISDNFKPRRWNHLLRGEDYSNVVMDTHQYQTFSARDKKLDATGHLAKTAGKVPRQLATMRAYHPIIIGEWSLALDRQSLQGLDEAGLETLRRAYGASQLLAYSQSSAWFYWTYKTEQGGVWDFRHCLQRGWLPSFAPKNNVR